jgi:hypothetical protein
MKVSTGEPRSHDFSIDELAYSYLDFSTRLSDDNYIHFSKLEVLKNLPLLFKLAKSLADRLAPDVTHICLLASSGMALGVGVALAAKRPLLFYRPEGWPKPEARGLGPRFMPVVPLNAKVALVDSHEHTRFTSARCFDELLPMGIQVVQLLAPTSFEDCIDSNWTRNIQYTALAGYSSLHSKLAKKYSNLVTSDELREIICATDNRFWLAPPIIRQDDPYFEFGAPGIIERPSWFLGKAPKDYQFETTNPHLGKLVRNKLVPNDEGRWSFFLDPVFVEEFASSAGKIINLGEYDYLIGTSHLGTALAIALAYYNFEEFHGHILFHLGRDGFVPSVPSLSGKKVLPIEMIITSGVYAVDIYLRVLQLGGRIDKYITAFQIPGSSRGWTQSRLASIPRLRKNGVRFISLTP